MGVTKNNSQDSARLATLTEGVASEKKISQPCGRSAECLDEYQQVSMT